MKSFINSFGTALLALMAVVTPAIAAEGRAELNVPFKFAVEGHTLPAGSYTVAQKGDLLYIEGRHRTMIVSPVLSLYTGQYQSKLIFQRKDGVPHLSNVQIGGEALNIPVHTPVTALTAH